MNIPFDDLPDSARIWIYTANRFLDKDEQEGMNTELAEFITGWTAHGNNLKAGFSILENCFLVIGIDRAYENASGCSIDASVEFIKQLEHTYNVSFLDWQNSAYSYDNTVQLIRRSVLEDKLKKGAIDQGIRLYNTGLSDKSGLREKWLVTLRETSLYNLING